MKKIRTLLVSFDNAIPASQISAFRGAIIEKAGREHVLFHNHLDDSKFVYAYPLIQYKHIGNNPSIICLHQGVDEIHHLFGRQSWTIQLQGKPVDLTIRRLDLNSFTLNIWEKHFNYQIRNWLALNEKNYKTYQRLSSLKEKADLLEKMLIGNILSFAKGVEWHIDKPVEVNIQELNGEKMVRYKGVPLMAFDVHFSTNVFLPNYLGLGKSASHGYGVVKEVKRR